MTRRSNDDIAERLDDIAALLDAQAAIPYRARAYPTAQRMDGIAGHAGLFSTADDLAIFARMLLDGGAVGGARVLRRESIASMTRPQSPPTGSRRRGLGWDLASPIASDHEEGARTGAYAHTGHTGIATSSTSFHDAHENQ